MLLSLSVAPLVGFAGLAYAASNGLAMRDECSTNQDVTVIYTQTIVFVYPIVVDQYCPATTVLTLDCGVSVNVTNAPTHLSTTVFATGTSSLAETISHGSGSVGSLDAAVSSAFSRQASSIVSSHNSYPSTISVSPPGPPYSNATSTASYTNSAGITVISMNAYTNSTGIVFTSATLNATYLHNVTSTPVGSLAPANTSLPLNTTIAQACLSVTTTSYTITQTPSAITAFVTELENVTAHSTQTAYTTVIFDTTLTDVSLKIATTSTTEVSSQILQTTVLHTSTTIFSEISVDSTETQLTTVLSTDSTVPIVARAEETSASYCSSAFVSSTTITEFAPTPTHTITQIQNIMKSTIDTSTKSTLTTLVNSTTKYSTATVTETISSNSTILDYNTITIPYTSTAMSFQTTTTTATVTNIVETPAALFYLQTSSDNTNESGMYLSYVPQGTNAWGHLFLQSAEVPEGLCGLNSNGNLICDEHIVVQVASGSSTVALINQGFETRLPGYFARLVCSLDEMSTLTCASINGNTIFETCDELDGVLSYVSIGDSDCVQVNLNAVFV